MHLNVYMIQSIDVSAKKDLTFRPKKMDVSAKNIRTWIFVWLPESLARQIFVREFRFGTLNPNPNE